jgi:uncharacterized repeat protein (TIGR03803 family)
MNTNYQQGNRWNRGYAQTCLRSLAIAVMFAVSLLAAQSASAQTYTVLHTFSGGADGGYPAGKLVRDSAGNLYGTTSTGGASGLGTLFRLDAKGKETVLHNFTGGTDGKNPASGVLRDAAGNLYGTTQLGGARRSLSDSLRQSSCEIASSTTSKRRIQLAEYQRRRFPLT